MNRRQMPIDLRLANLIGQELMKREDWMRRARAARHAAGPIAQSRDVARRYVLMARITNRVMLQFQQQLSAERRAPVAA